VTGKRKRGRAQLVAVEETGQDELESTRADINLSRPRTIRQSIEVPFSAQKTPAIRPVDGNKDEEPDELSPEQDGPAIKNPIREVQTPTLLRRLSERRDPSRTHQSVASAAGRSSVISSIEEDEVGEDELSFLQEKTDAVEDQVSSRTRNSSSELAMPSIITNSLNISLTVPNNQSTRREIFEVVEQREPVDETIPSAEDIDDDDAAVDELSPVQDVRPRRSKTIARKPPVIDDDAIGSDASEDELSPPQPKKSTRPNKSPIDVHQDVTHDEVSEIDELSPQPTQVPRKQKQPQPSRPPLTQTAANVPQQSKKSKPAEQVASPPRKKARTTGGVVGITVYRRTESNNIAYDPLGADPNPGITPADVLAQVSGELATNHITGFLQKARLDKTSKKARRRQVNVLTYFRDILSDSLFELQNAHLSSHALASQLRASNRQKRQLRAELMAKRQEREDLDLQIDRFRAEHRAKMEREDKQHALVQNLCDIELAVRRGKEKAKEEEREDEEPDMGVEMLVGNVMDSVGLLGRVREWNGLLEESAASLEARA
jgi:hypothetical protein